MNSKRCADLNLKKDRSKFLNLKIASFMNLKYSFKFKRQEMNSKLRFQTIHAVAACYLEYEI
ncbi:hypothetical protein HMPREF0026_03073 [Acinetobacter junii SH205]|uniref:Uncharacterized protein n=1 Tax=Acinetobacter junii SH205 TaxID=575587 RepID=D0SRG3_ACIJU|nr:hypothetical protein HMPREF0026_03073 [Acinetobacter junii SH205]